MTSLSSQARRALSFCAALLALHCSSSSTNPGAGGGGPAVVQCGLLSCDVTQGKSCCFAADDTGVTQTECSGNCLAKYTQTTSCDDRADCAAQGSEESFCCATLKPVCSDQNPEQCILSAQCALEEGCAGAKTIILCDPKAHNSCPGQRVCTPAPGKLRKGVCSP